MSVSHLHRQQQHLLEEDLAERAEGRRAMRQELLEEGLEVEGVAGSLGAALTLADHVAHLRHAQVVLERVIREGDTPFG